MFDFPRTFDPIALGNRIAAEMLADLNRARPYRIPQPRPRSDVQADYDTHQQEIGEGSL